MSASVTIKSPEIERNSVQTATTPRAVNNWSLGPYESNQQKKSRDYSASLIPHSNSVMRHTLLQHNKMMMVANILDLVNTSFVQDRRFLKSKGCETNL